MKKVGIWFLNNLKWLLTVVIFLVTAAVIGNNMLSSYNAYKSYEKVYYENDLELRSNSPATPKSIEFDDEFVKYNNDQIASSKSRHKNNMTFNADELVVSTGQNEFIVDDYIDLTEKGGSIQINLALEEKSFLDIDFVISSVKETTANDETTYGVKNLLSNVDFVINGETMDDEVDLENSSGNVEWHHLIMSGFALPAGNVSITIKNKSGKSALMPQLKCIHLFSSEVLQTLSE